MVHSASYVNKEPSVLNVKLSIGKFCSIGPETTVFLGEEHHSDWKYEYIYNAQKFLQCSDIDSLYEYYEDTVKGQE